MQTPQSEKKISLPASVTLQVTEACNLRCNMCYEWGETGIYSNARSGVKPAVLDIDLIKRVVGELADARPTYSLFGGEPLNHPHLEEIIRTIKDAGSSVDTPTNGTLLSRHAEMLVRTGFDSVRISLDGPREVNDSQRGKGSYRKAMAGIEALYDAKQKAQAALPLVSIIYTVTPENHLHTERFFLQDLNLSAIDWVTIQMQNFVTEEMGKAYAEMMEKDLGLTGERYWRALVRSPEDFARMNIPELARQIDAVCRRLEELGKNTLLLPPTCSEENLSAYFGARWAEMTDSYHSCPVPWNSADVTATGDLAPCHVLFDLVVGNLYQNTFADLWNGETYRRFREYMKRHGLMSICPGCCILYLVGS